MTMPETAIGPGRIGGGTGELRKRVRSAIVLAAIVLAALLAGGWAFALVWLAAAIVGAREWLAMSRTAPLAPLFAGTALALAALVLALRLGASPAVLGGLGLVGALALAGLARGGRAGLSAMLGFCGACVIALVPPALRDDPGIGLVGPAWMFAIVWASDIAAYFAGRRFGGPKLMPRVSPKKTWSGALAGLAAATLAGTGLVLAARGQGWGGVPTLPAAGVALVCAAASTVSQAGDLLESALKRRYGVKDSGGSIPGHGGIMDRLDGFFAVAAVVGVWLVLRHALAA